MNAFIHNVLLIGLPYVGAALAAAITVLYAKRQIKQYNPEVWPAVEQAFYASGIFFIALAGTFRRNFLSMAGARSGSKIEEIGIELVVTTLFSIGACCFLLWYKGQLKAKYVQIYALSYLLGLICLAVCLFIYVVGVKYALSIS